MRVLITKTTIKMCDGDKKILRAKMLSENLENSRKQVMDRHPMCKSVQFVYEELPVGS